MNVEYRIPEMIIIAEFILVIMIILFTYFLRMVIYFRSQSKRKEIEKIYSYLNTLIATHAPFIIEDFPRHCQNIEILIPILYDLSKNPDNDAWLSIRKHFIHDLILPLARQATDSHAWITRMYAAEAFSLDDAKYDEKFIVQLVNDNVPLVSVNAINAALSHKNETAINVIISKMDQERRLTQTLYLQAFQTAPAETRKIIETRLLTDTDSFARATCYKILEKYPPEKIYWNTDEDIQSNNIELKLSAIRLIAKSGGKSAIPFLARLLQNPSWEVKVVAIHCLSEVDAQEVMTEIAACLHDYDWWVRLHAAQALKKFGDHGIQILKNIDPTQDRYAYEMAQHVLEII